MDVEQREFYGSSVEDAIERAERSLGIKAAELDYQVIDEGSAGFLGIGARDARISVVVPSLVKSGSDDDVMLTREESSPEISSGNPQDLAEEEATVSAETPATTPVSEEALLEVDRFLTSLVDTMGLDATVDVFESDEAIVADISLQQTGLFIGQKGETIDAVQHLTNVFASKNSSLPKRIVVDSEGYRQRRVEALQGMAHRTARRAIKEGRSVNLPPMSAAERRVVHLYLAENSRVTTSSEGSEGSRYVVVSPD
jgi:spoIIIJ-associated protein